MGRIYSQSVPTRVPGTSCCNPRSWWRRVICSLVSEKIRHARKHLMTLFTEICLLLTSVRAHVFPQFIHTMVFQPLGWSALGDQAKRSLLGLGGDTQRIGSG
ncbi:hypothetical protein AVEN_34321-1 [Araneus ventricosus]|uniref:Uncharacterized protein n=1 Tax=Araneus ventricosus TaxID=182803 RepID=A0A4Y2G2P4_ARAVE|nr:hypothetical protein AVEN_34321-1 [Araneus ventricosus]